MAKEQERAMRKLGFSEEEIQDVLECDKRIDRGEKLFEQSAEEKAATKAMKQAERKKDPPNYQFTKRERKPNEAKRQIIGVLTNTLENWFESDNQGTYNACANINIINPEREIEFEFCGNRYKIVLSAPRK